MADVAMSLDAMLNKKGNTQCMKDTIERYYSWAQQRGALRELCMGCFDVFCDHGFTQQKCAGIEPMDVPNNEEVRGENKEKGFNWKRILELFGVRALV